MMIRAWRGHATLSDGMKLSGLSYVVWSHNEWSGSWHSAMSLGRISCRAFV